jgi:hypothetical protein
MEAKPGSNRMLLKAILLACLAVIANGIGKYKGNHRNSGSNNYEQDLLTYLHAMSG